MEKVNLTVMLALFRDQQNPRIVSKLNGKHVKLAKLLGEFIWHKHVSQGIRILSVREIITKTGRLPCNLVVNFGLRWKASAKTFGAIPASAKWNLWKC